MAQFSPKRGVIAAGHAQTAEAGRLILEAGGNAFDAAIAAVLAACVVESSLTSLGGGGFLLGKSGQQPATLFDFFCQTPRQCPPLDRVDFYPVTLNFGGARQTFHIGQGAIAVPGMVAGLYAVHQAFGTLPFHTLIEPAVSYAQQGFQVNEFNAFTYRLLAPILQRFPEAADHYAPGGKRLETGDTAYLPQFADFLQQLARYGPHWFYRGEFAHYALESLADGSILSEQDWSAYQVIRRSPLTVDYRQFQLLTNPPPSSGGILIGFALQLLQEWDLSHYPLGSAEQIQLFSEVMAVTSQARKTDLDGALYEAGICQKFLEGDSLNKHQRLLQDLIQQEANSGPCNKLGSTTHISVLDEEENAVSFTSSNGEGSSHVIPGTGIMLNNMLGEADLNPRGFYQWPTNQRLASMMSPSLILHKGQTRLVLGSGGSNRIRSAILQVICHCLDYQLPLTQAIAQPRLHWEDQQLDLEPQPFDPAELHFSDNTQVTLWTDQNMFFGGVHAVGLTPDGSLQGVGDARRAGVMALSGT